jgi:TolB-like protein
MSGDPEVEYFSDGITEDIISGLKLFRELIVIARTIVQPRRCAVPVPEIVAHWAPLTS